jgi:uncharacterized protein YcnI
MQNLMNLALCASAALLSAPLAAHPVLAVPQASAGSFYKATIGITHGCAGTATREVIVSIPAGVSGAKPVPKPGWTIEVERVKLAQPRESHGRKITEDVVKIRWSGGSLPSSYFDEFVLVANLPQQPGPVYWNVTQVCDQGRADWNEIPAAGQSPHDLKSPALRLEVTADPHAGHKH